MAFFCYLKKSKNTLYILPHISELRWKIVKYFEIDKDNEPQTIKKTKKRYKKFQEKNDCSNHPSLNYSIVKKLSKNKSEPDIELFYEKVLPYLLKKFPRKKVVNIGIVCHQVYMKNLFNRDRYFNTAIELQEFDWEDNEIKNEKHKVIYKGIDYKG